MKRLGFAVLLTAFSLGGYVPGLRAQSGVEAGATVARLDGSYDRNRDQCENLNSQTRLSINDGTFRFYELQCTFGRKGGQVETSEGTLLCIGEGQRFKRDIVLNLRPDGVQIVENGASMDYARCPD